MSCNKRLPAAAAIGLVLGLTLGAAWLRAVAAPTPSFDALVSPTPATAAIALSASSAPAVARHLATSRTSVPLKTTVTEAPPSEPAAIVVNASTAAAASAPLASDGTHLTLGEIDRLARNKVASSLRGAEGSSQPVAGAAPVKPAAAQPAVQTSQSRLASGYSPRARTEPVSFFGSYVDSAGQHVLYQYNDAIYDARVGEKLLNGWTARAVKGQVVTVAEGRHTWSVPMKGDATTPAPVATAGTAPGAVPLLGDLSRPLPSLMLTSPAN